jgi:hypothetical protein
MEKSDLQRNRFKYEIGQWKFLLISERFLYFKKVNLPVVKNLVFYSLPEDPEIFKDLCEFVNPGNYVEALEKFNYEDKNDNSKNDSAVISLVNKSLEILSLSKILGYDKANKIKNDFGNYIC